MTTHTEQLALGLHHLTAQAQCGDDAAAAVLDELARLRAEAATETAASFDEWWNSEPVQREVRR